MGFFDLFKTHAAPAPQAHEQTREQRRALDAGLEKTQAGLFSKLARAVAGRLGWEGEPGGDLGPTEEVDAETHVIPLRLVRK